MSAFNFLIHELAAHGKTTYAALCRKYPGYDMNHFSTALNKARRLGLAERKAFRNAPIVAAQGAACPCCGRPFEEAHDGR